MDNSSPKIYTEFLPISRADMEARGWEQLDFVVVGGDAYVDHPSFGTAIISRLLEAEGYKIGVLAQPRYTDCEDFKRFGKPKYGFFIGGGNVDSMVSHYSVAKIPRAEDEYSPGGKGGARPDRSATVYTRLAKRRIVSNPPYGERLMEKREAEGLYRDFGRAVQGLLTGWRINLLSSHTEFERTFGRTADKKRKLYNGMIKCDLFQYHEKKKSAT